MPDTGDVGFDAAPDRVDAPPDATVDAEEATADAGSPEADVAPADRPPTEDGCAADPPSGPPAESNRSCGDGGAPAWQCREIHACGTPFTMGQLGAQEMDPGGPQAVLPIRPCDLHVTTPHPGYVDAYEVTVARFRAWMRAGMPRPAEGAVWFNGLVWRWGEFVMPPGAPNSQEREPDAGPTPSQCTYSETPGVNDDLPINCVTPATAAAFCWWDGKHIVTEAAWEYFARNRGTTTTPWGEALADRRACMYGHVAAFSDYCATAPRPREVGGFPPGVSRDPAGVYDLYGGVQEYTLGFRRPYNPHPSDGPPPCPALPAGFHDDARLSGDFVMRGAAWNFGIPDFQAYARSATRGALPQPAPGTAGDARQVRSPRAGIRCARWVPEPRGTSG